MAHDANEASLPDSSSYHVLSSGLSIMQDCEGALVAGSVDAETWAKQVEGDILKAKPQIWRGTKSRLGRYRSLLQLGTFDGQYLKKSGLGKLKRAVEGRPSDDFSTKGHN